MAGAGIVFSDQLGKRLVFDSKQRAFALEWSLPPGLETVRKVFHTLSTASLVFEQIRG